MRKALGTQKMSLLYFLLCNGFAPKIVPRASARCSFQYDLTNELSHRLLTRGGVSDLSHSYSRSETQM